MFIPFHLTNFLLGHVEDMQEDLLIIRDIWVTTSVYDNSKLSLIIATLLRIYEFK